MKRKKIIVALALFLIGLTTIVTIGLTQDKRSPLQKINQYYAIRNLNTWSFYGFELYSSSTIAVYDMKGRTKDDLPKPIGEQKQQVRKFGLIVEGEDHFNLGEDDYDDDRCIDYIYWTLGNSANPEHRIVATSIFQRDLKYYPVTSLLKDKLLEDSDERIRLKMKSVIEHDH